MSTICDDLRAAILQAAMQGKLTKQLPEDGSAEDLLEEIKAEKEKVIKNGLIKKQKIIEPLTDTPFDIPESWRWVQLSDLVYVYSGLAYNKKDLDEKIVNEVTVFRGGNISNMSYYFKADDVKIDKKFIPKDELFLRKNQLITPAVTSQSNLGKIARIDIDYPNVVAGGFVLNIIPYVISDDIFSKLFCYFFSSPFYKERCNEIANKSGQAFYNLNRTKLQESAFPLPPFDEQKRIVEKVDELMARIADLEQSADALASLKKAFPDDIKTSLLQAAMQGKLTEQLPEDGDAEELLEKIRAEKRRRIESGEMKRTKKLPEISETDYPCTIADSWSFCYIDDIAFVIKLAGFEYTKDIAPNLSHEGVPLFKGKNVQNGELILDFESYIPESVSDMLPRSQIRKKCLLTPYVGTIGNIAIFNGNFRAHLGSNVGKIELLYDGDKQLISEEFLLYYLRSKVGYSELTKYKKATAQESISIDAIRNVIVPMPPLTEQKRIVECLDALMHNINVVGDLIASE